MKRTLWMWALALVAALAMVAAGCGDDDDEGGGGEGGGGGTPAAQVIEKNPANSGKSITIGSKNFPEQFILGEIYTQSLEAAGYSVKKELNLGDEGVAFKSLKAGEIDAYPEYIGTSLSSHLKVKVTAIPKDPQEAFDQLVEGQKKNQVTPLPRTPFENTYRVGMLKETYDRLGVKTLSELKGKEGDLTINGYPECKQRPDCLLGLQNTYDLKFKDFIASQDPYPILDSKKADVAMVFTTDAPLSTDKYAVLEDDKHLFPPYQVTLLVRDDKLQELGPDAQKTVENVQKGLTEEVMQELNSRVVLDKQKPEKVAADYLREAGYVK
ncbi:MAG TPA: glycine betaine ABC transporter substrate-binding protein [Thermoleophilaceae bacterium]|jgi:glycine betaine/choline ABC-type transport system substrate-binding protein